MTAERLSGYLRMASSIAARRSPGTYTSAGSGTTPGAFSRSTALSHPRAVSGSVMFGTRSVRSGPNAPAGCGRPPSEPVTGCCDSGTAGGAPIVSVGTAGLAAGDALFAPGPVLVRRDPAHSPSVAG